MEFSLKLVLYFLLWTLYSYGIHVLAHAKFKNNYLNYLHLRHHAYKHEGRRWPPLHDYFFWFGSWRGTLDVWITFTLPLLVLLPFEPAVAATLLVFHYIYEVFLSRDILDHNPQLGGWVTRAIPVGHYHLKHHRNYRCNYSFFITVWDHLFGTIENGKRMKETRSQTSEISSVNPLHAATAGSPRRIPFRNHYAAHPLRYLTLTFVVLPLVFAAGTLWLHLRDSLPPHVAELHVAGLQGAVHIERNAQGLVSIRADHDRDTFFALGYVHAQDRLWQLELARRTVRGEVSDLFGQSALPLDVLTRTLDIQRNAETSLASLSPQAREALDAYAAGINGWIDTHTELPAEFALLGVPAAHWMPADSIGWLKILALNMGLNFRDELDALALRSTLNQAQLGFVAGVQAQPSLPQTAATGLSALAMLSRGLERDWAIGGRAIGSNAWAVAGSLTDSGRPVVANDPHLGLEMPSQWYAASLHGDRIAASGMGLIGVPGILLGGNPKIAWGATNLMADTEDLFFEQVDPARPGTYRRGERWLEFQERRESIKVRADFPSFLREPLAPIEIVVRRTVDGPVLSDAVGTSDQVVTLKWTGDDPSDTSFDAFLAANYASDTQGLTDALSMLVAPALNLVYADAGGNIGSLAAGRVPLRGMGDGRLPLPAWTPASAWLGSIPYAELPRRANPPEGYVVAANHDVLPPDYPHFVSLRFAEPARARRIAELLEENGRDHKLSLDDHRSIQLDQQDATVTKLLPQLLATEVSDESQTAMLQHLHDWSGATTGDSIAATIFFTWAHHLRARLFDDEFRAPWAQPELGAQLRSVVREMPLRAVAAALQDAQLDWCDDRSTAARESCADIKRLALADSAADLRDLLGSDVDDWHWADAQRIEFPHRPFNSVRGLDALFGRSVSHGGSPDSINVAAGRFDPSRGFVQVYGAAFRQLIEVGGPTDRHWYVNSTGQSGNFMSRHYDDMIEPFASGQYFSFSPLPPDADAAVGHIVLLPGQAL